VLPALLLVMSLVAKRHESLADLVTGQPVVDAALLAGVAVAFKFRLKAMQWLDRRFFRAEYDAREILVSLAGRVPFETDPHELTSLVLHRIDQALHPTVAAVLASGIESGALLPISVLHGTVERLAQVASNLIANALQYGDPKEPVLVEIDGTADDTVEMVVSNAGNIPREVLPQIFDPFRGRSEPSRRSEGLGLGLYIVKELVEAHEGRVDVTSNPGERTRFTVRLPRRPSPD